MKKTYNDLEIEILDLKEIIEILALYLPKEEQDTFRYMLQLKMYDKILDTLTRK